MAGKTDSTSHTEVIKALRRHIAAAHPEGGWLTAGREMAARLGVSQPTYFKALKCLAEESWVQSHPKRGHYATPERLRNHKVGVVVREGRLAPYIPDNLVRCFGEFTVHGYGVITILANSFDKLYENAIVRDVDGLLWLSPPTNAAKTIDQIQAAGDMPLVLVDSSRLPAVPSGVGRVDHNWEGLNRKRVETMLERGHRSLLYISSHEFAVMTGLETALHEAGVPFGPERCLDNIIAKPGQLARSLRRHHATGIIAEGGPNTVDRLFAELSELPEPDRPEVLATYFPDLASLAAQYPNVRLLPAQWTLAEALETTAAQMLVQHLRSKKPLESLKIGPCKGKGNQDGNH